jgi:hypothetical protein
VTSHLLELCETPWQFALSGRKSWRLLELKAIRCYFSALYMIGDEKQVCRTSKSHHWQLKIDQMTCQSCFCPCTVSAVIWSFYYEERSKMQSIGIDIFKLLVILCTALVHQIGSQNLQEEECYVAV